MPRFANIIAKIYAVLGKTTISTRPSFIGFQCVADFFVPNNTDVENPFFIFLSIFSCCRVPSTITLGLKSHIKHVSNILKIYIMNKR